jgi:hypothetical protein
MKISEISDIQLKFPLNAFYHWLWFLVKFDDNREYFFVLELRNFNLLVPEGHGKKNELLTSLQIDYMVKNKATIVEMLLMKVNNKEYINENVSIISHEELIKLLKLARFDSLF